MHDTKLCFLTALEIAKKIHKGEISAVETMEAHLTQIERINPQVNAIVTFIPELALEEARKADEKQAKGGNIGRLHGLPIAHKDLVPTKGIRTTFGSLVFSGFHSRGRCTAGGTFTGRRCDYAWQNECSRIWSWFTDL